MTDQAESAGAEAQRVDGEEPEPDVVEASPLVVLRLRLQLDESADPWLQRFLDVRGYQEAGDNRTAARTLRELLVDGQLPDSLRAEAVALQRRLRPDNVALLVAAASAILLIVIWIAAVSA